MDNEEKRIMETLQDLIKMQEKRVDELAIKLADFAIELEKENLILEKLKK